MTDNALDDIGQNRPADELADVLLGEGEMDPDEQDDELDDEFSDALALNSDTFALWQGHQGNLDPKQHDTLVALLKKSFISSDDKDAWRTLVRDPGPSSPA